jgi:hypothetical protein
VPIWLVRATWTEDEAEVNAETAHDALKAVATHLRFQPHHVEARQCAPEAIQEAIAAGLSPGEARRLPQ